MKTLLSVIESDAKHSRVKRQRQTRGRVGQNVLEFHQHKAEVDLSNYTLFAAVVFPSSSTGKRASETVLGGTRLTHTGDAHRNSNHVSIGHVDELKWPG